MRTRKGIWATASSFRWWICAAAAAACIERLAMLQYAALTYSRIHASALPLPLSSNGFASRSLVVRFMSPGCKQSGEKEYEEASKNRSSDERTTFDKNPSSERAPSAKRRRAAAAAATMCPMISRRRSLEFELCRTAAASPTNPERCTSATTRGREDGENRSAEERRGRWRGKRGGFIQSWGITRWSRIRRPLLPRRESEIGAAALLASRSLTLLSTPLHFHGFVVDARLPRIDGGAAGGGRERGTRSFVHRLMAVPFETH